MDNDEDSTADNWAEERKRRMHLEFRQLRDEQAAMWTPNRIFQSCCVKWLAHGALPIDDEGWEDDDWDNEEWSDSDWDENYKTVVRSGCRSRQSSSCKGRDHPNIDLSLHGATPPATTAKLSHRLDPFVQYMERRVAESTASRVDDYTYHLVGYVRENVHHCLHENRTRFGSHLVNVSHYELRKSDRAHREALEGATSRKRQKIADSSLLTPGLVEEALEICRINNLERELNQTEVCALRLTSKACSKVALRMTAMFDHPVATRVFADKELRRIDAEQRILRRTRPLTGQEMRYRKHVVACAAL